MTAVAEKTTEREVLIPASKQVVEGRFIGYERTSTGSIRLLFDTGEFAIMPANWSVQFDLWKGMGLRAGYVNKKFILEELEEIPE